MEWVTVKEQIGYFGSDKKVILEGYDIEYGRCNWRIVWKFGGKFLDFEKACKKYEKAYFKDSYNRQSLWDDLRKTAGEVYDIEEKDTESGLDYLIQKGQAMHIQDIAVRNVFKKRGWNFEGKEMVRIRSNSEYEFGKQLSPMRVEFHKPELIIQPPLKGWWNKQGIKNSVEEWYQSNKTLQIKKK